MLTKRISLRVGFALLAALVAVALPEWRSATRSVAYARPAPSAAGVAYVTAAEVDAALKQMPAGATTYDKPIKTVDTGEYKVTIVILRRIPGKTPDSSLSHERVTEVYHMLIGTGTFETGGTLVDGKPVDLTSEAAGPSTRGTIEGGETRPIGPGDNVVIPPGVPHRFSHIDGPVTYLVTRIEAPRR
jgi:mannose-6-phosphate isomerase-like protein (cupin superfamily)